jgi:hypothetical protein
MKMKLGPFVAMGVLSALACQAQANGGVVESLDGNKAILNVGLLGVQVGDRIGLNVEPTRRYGSGQAIVTDMDLLSHRVAVVLVAPLSNHGLLPKKGRKEYPEEGIGVPRYDSDFKLFERETVKINSLHRYVSSVPDFKLPKSEPPVEPTFHDILLPREVTPRAVTTTSASTP